MAAPATSARSTPAVLPGTRLRLRGILAPAGGLLAVGILAVLVGPVRLETGGVIRELVDRLPLVDLTSGLSEREATILWELRLPRVVLGGLVGATLAMAGAAYQGVFRNPLADPYLLGVAAGAGLGATLAIAYLPESAAWPVPPLPVAAFAGGLAEIGRAHV